MPRAANTILRNATRNLVIAARVDRPARRRSRWLGLLARPPLQEGEALWLEPCGGIHTWGLRQPIDVVFLDRGLRVLGVARGVLPWRLAWAPRGTRSVVELPAGGAAAIASGDLLEVAGA